jgi:hypothetical protein
MIRPVVSNSQGLSSLGESCLFNHGDTSLPVVKTSSRLAALDVKKCSFA